MVWMDNVKKTSPDGVIRLPIVKHTLHDITMLHEDGLIILFDCYYPPWCTCCQANTNSRNHALLIKIPSETCRTTSPPEWCLAAAASRENGDGTNSTKKKEIRLSTTNKIQFSFTVFFQNPHQHKIHSIRENKICDLSSSINCNKRKIQASLFRNEQSRPAESSKTRSRTPKQTRDGRTDGVVVGRGEVDSAHAQSRVRKSIIGQHAANSGEGKQLSRARQFNR